MALRIKKVCKDKKLTMNELAKRLDISPISLSSAVNGNPTIGWLQKVADSLGVEVADLIERKEPLVSGCVIVGDDIYPIKSKADLVELAARLG